MNAPFVFKQFSVHQDRCAMKIGTDGVLLGAWVSIQEGPQSILDIGAGTGLIAIMLAQRSNADLIDAIEIDAQAYEQCVENFEASPWNDRLFCYHASLEEFAAEIDDTYDLIVANPPFYSENVTSGDTSRNRARQNHYLPFHTLIEAVGKLLSTYGSFALVIPFKEEQTVISLAKEKNLFPRRITHVKGTPEAPVKRSLIEFVFQNEVPERDTLVIEKSRHEYTDTYRLLTQDFYLKM
ncbi:tRNA1(Val) (adenine(37)-N6)-methyltransferase [Ascidiimonas aurantiaca]|uniref:tRNA1(Val) (adenine(37)-N6)-methyltransferase n=1 Tax=Ascidiimonas aurantiaca TaxID=1685432 RepID=UPI0030EF6400